MLWHSQIGAVKSILKIKIFQKINEIAWSETLLLFSALVLRVTAQMQLLCLSLLHLCRKERIVRNILFWC